MTTVSKQATLPDQSSNESTNNDSTPLNIYFKNASKKIDPAKIESVEEFLKRGGAVHKVASKKKPST